MIEKLNAFIDKIVAIILTLLPDSPFTDTINNIQKADWLHQLNWFVPVGTFVTITTVWINAIVVFYVYQIILRWAKAVAD